VKGDVAAQPDRAGDQGTRREFHCSAARRGCCVDRFVYGFAILRLAVTFAPNEVMSKTAA
jgi:hypothetical protein